MGYLLRIGEHLAPHFRNQKGAKITCKMSKCRCLVGSEGQPLSHRSFHRRINPYVLSMHAPAAVAEGAHLSHAPAFGERVKPHMPAQHDPASLYPSPDSIVHHAQAEEDDIFSQKDHGNRTMRSEHGHLPRDDEWSFKMRVDGPSSLLCRISTIFSKNPRTLSPFSRGVVMASRVSHSWLRSGPSTEGGFDKCFESVRFLFRASITRDETRDFLDWKRVINPGNLYIINVKTAHCDASVSHAVVARSLWTPLTCAMPSTATTADALPSPLSARARAHAPRMLFAINCTTGSISQLIAQSSEAPQL